MFGLGLSEILFLGVLALIVIGPKQLPELARNLGRFLNELKRATDGLTDDLKSQTRIDFDLKSRRLRDPEDLLEKKDDKPSDEPVISSDKTDDKPEKPS